MYQDEAQTDSQTGEVVRGTVGLCCSTEHYQHEDAGEDNLREQTAQNGDVGLQVVSAGAVQAGDVGREQGQKGRSDESTHHLTANIAAGILARHATGEPDTEGDGGIDVATGDASDGISHGYYGQTECEGRAHDGRDVVNRVATQAYGNSAAHQHEHHGAHHFC